MVIGGDLYEQVKHYDDYRFKEMSEFSLGFKMSYPIYSIKKGCTMSSNFDNINKKWARN